MASVSPFIRRSTVTLPVPVGAVRRSLVGALSIILAGVGATLPAVAQSTAQPAADQPVSREERERLDEARRQLERDRERAETLDRQTKALADEIAQLRAKIVDQARAVQDQEEDVTSREGEVRTLGRQIQQKERLLTERRQQLVTTLAALQRLARRPPQALLFSDTAPVDTVRSAMLLKVAVPQIEARANALRRELDELAAARTDLAAKQAAGSVAARKLDSDRLELRRLLQENERALRSATEDRERALTRARRSEQEAKTLEELVERLEAERRAYEEQQQRLLTAAVQRAVGGKPRRPGGAGTEIGGPDEGVSEASTSPAPRVRPVVAATDGARGTGIRSFPAARASLTPPARGTVVRRFGERSEFDTALKGIEVDTRKGAQVVAPFDGQVVFAGPFRGYGQVLIIEHNGGYHSLLAGVAESAAQVGAWVVAGEPVGAMGATGRDGDANPVLYYELRRAGRPVDPLPWIAARDGKVKG